uniref:tRNA-dihydrouridine(16/17) synthase [NAD(P)(+)] n=1 Tax=Ciona savignyi TaxID=51511 RepID=H2Y7H4_CIOSA
MPSGYEFYERVLKSAKYVVAPMVDQSELAWRMLARKHGAQLCYSPMYSANTFVHDHTYRKKVLQDLSCGQDRPLIVQFCANSPEIFLQASLLVEPHCDGVDLNLGCPQHIAKRGHFGAYLQDDWSLISDIVSTSKKQLSIGVTVKIRIFPEISKTVEYAQMLERSGCDLITVHGRTRAQKGPSTGLASWDHIKAVKESVDIPVFANGNIQYFRDIEECMLCTGVNGVMAAEGHLTNPMIFKDLNPPPNVYDVMSEYFDFVDKYPCPVSFVRSHMFKIWARTLLVHREMRNTIGSAATIEILMNCNDELKQLCLNEDIKDHSIPHWVCQPYIRPNRLPQNTNHNITQTIAPENNSQDPHIKLSKNEMRRRLKY